MANTKSFKIGIRRKVPYLTNLFLIIGGICFLVIIIFDLIFYPFRNIPEEIRSILFYLLVPEFWKKVLIFSIIGFCATSILYMRLRFYKPALLMFRVDSIMIRGRYINMIIPVKKISRIIINDAISMNNQIEERLSILLEYDKKQATSVKLKNYSEAEEFVEEIIKYPDLNLKFYNFLRIPAHLNED